MALFDLTPEERPDGTTLESKPFSCSKRLALDDRLRQKKVRSLLRASSRIGYWVGETLCSISPLASAAVNLLFTRVVVM